MLAVRSHNTVSIINMIKLIQRQNLKFLRHSLNLRRGSNSLDLGQNERKGKRLEELINKQTYL